MQTYDNAGIVATKAPELEIVRAELDKAIEAVYHEVEGLEARLQVVLLPDMPSVNKMQGETSEPHSQLVIHLRSMILKVSDIYRRVESIKSRLEL